MVDMQVRACSGQGQVERSSLWVRPSSSTPRLQELYYEIVHVLSLMLEDLPQKKQSKSSEKVDEK